MKNLASITLLITLLLSCSKDEIIVSKDIPDEPKIPLPHASKIIIKNYGYFNTRGRKIYITTIKQEHGFEFFGDTESSIELPFDPDLRVYTYEGETVTKIDLNCGSPYDDINFEEKNITYTPYKDEKQIIIKNHKSIDKERFYSITDPTGIYEGPKNTIVQTYRNKKNPEIININIMPWGSKFANLDGKNHFFDTKSADKLTVYNMYSNHNDNNSITPNVMISYDNNTSISMNKNSIINRYSQDYYVGSRKIQSIDFNNGKSADDLNFSTSSHPGVVEYIAKYSEYPSSIIDSNIGFIFGTVDGDGINGISANAEIRAFVDNRDYNNLIIEIYK